MRLCFVSADQIGLPVARDFGIQGCWHADSSRVSVYTWPAGMDRFDLTVMINIWGNGDFVVYKLH